MFTEYAMTGQKLKHMDQEYPLVGKNTHFDHINKQPLPARHGHCGDTNLEPLANDSVPLLEGSFFCMMCFQEVYLY